MELQNASLQSSLVSDNKETHHHSNTPVVSGYIPLCHVVPQIAQHEKKSYQWLCVIGFLF